MELRRIGPIQFRNKQQAELHRTCLLTARIDGPNYDQHALSHELVKAYERDLGLRADLSASRFIFDISKENANIQLVIEPHETGPEIFLIVVSFVAGAVASGVIGNLAYDMLKELYDKTIKVSLKNRDTRVREADFHPFCKVEVTVLTSEGSETDVGVCFEFDPSKKLHPKVVHLLISKIEGHSNHVDH